MVSSITSLGSNGVYDWLAQRLSALVLLAWILFVCIFIASTEVLTAQIWQALFSQTWMRVFSMAALLALCAHAWVGMWTISTDYLTSALLGKVATAVRFLFQLVCLLVLLTYFVWCAQILWSI